MNQGIPSPFLNDEPWISPNNRMDAKELKDFEAGKDHPIIEMSDKKNLLYMALQNLSFMDTEDFDFMASIIYDVDNKTIEMRGRLRFETSGNKQIFSDPKPIRYNARNYQRKKEQIKSFSTDIVDRKIFKAKEPLFEMEFAIGEDINSLTNKMNLSNRFNIGSIPKK